MSSSKVVIGGILLQLHVNAFFLFKIPINVCIFKNIVLESLEMNELVG